MTPRPRLQFLDALRGIAVALVVWSHLGWVSGSSWSPLPTVDLGHMGVMTFFALSGFVIPLSLEGASLRAFWIRRALRLFPPYWLALVFAVLLASQGIYGTEHPQVSAVDIAANLTMLQKVFRIESFIGPAWSLLVEIFFYALASVVVALRWRWRWCALALALVASVLPQPHYHFSITVYLALMSGGAVAYEVWRRRTPLWVGLAVLAGVLAMLVWSSRADLPSLLQARLLAVPAFLGALLLGGLPWPRALVWLGRISYSLYLFHLPIFCILLVLLGQGWHTALLAVCGSVLVAWLVFRWVERPSIGLGHRLSRPSVHAARVATPRLLLRRQ
jgi:peptidoglycan/LPS O-acetylase OafA/YrhL